MVVAYDLASMANGVSAAVVSQSMANRMYLP